MSSNTFGKLFRLTTFGESHGTSIGCVVDGVPPLIRLNEEDIQVWLDKRKPGQSKFTTQRKESDKVEIISGVFQGKTTGTPIGLIINNEDTRSKDYNSIAKKIRPRHADFTYWKKYGIRDYRGGGRSSARETALRVAGGAIARKILIQALGENINIRGALIQLGPNKINYNNWKWDNINQNPFFCPDKDSVPLWEKYIDSVRKRGSSTGAIIEIVADGIPAGLGSPVYAKLDSELAAALMSINAVKGVEIGAGFNVAKLSGEENADEIQLNSEGKVIFLKNNSGGILGGISTGQSIISRIAIKPTSSILKPLKSIDIDDNNIEIKDLKLLEKGYKI